MEEKSDTSACLEQQKKHRVVDYQTTPELPPLMFVDEAPEYNGEKLQLNIGFVR